MLWSPRDLSKLTWAKVKDRRGVKGPREGCEAVKPPKRFREPKRRRSPGTPCRDSMETEETPAWQL